MREFYKNGDIATIVWRKFCSHHALRKVNDTLSIPFIRKWVKKFEATGLTMAKPKFWRPRSSRTHQYVDGVNQSVCDVPKFSILECKML